MVYLLSYEKGTPLLKDHLNLGGDNGKCSIEVTSRYLVKNGKPWLPVMGEYHFSRANPQEWKRELCKMKAGGIDIVSSYVIWIHHEEEEGIVRFDENCDLRRFVQTCFQLGLFVILRVGPWVHGEVKNGGFPDWLLKKPNIHPRSNDPQYLDYVKKWYKTLAQQLQGLLFEDGSGLIGFQIENELARDKEHIDTLLKLALQSGLQAPLYTATGWGIPTDADLPEGKVLPVYSCYSEAPWAGHTEKLPPSRHYCFSPVRNDHTVGADLIPVKQANGGALDYGRYPFATCEMGGGVQVTYSRRPIISGEEIAAMTLVKLGSGNNLPGYYMYHGGRNPIGKVTTMQESKKSGYPNDLPIIDYDFQAPLGAWGAPRAQYDLCRIVTLFLRDFGEQMALLQPSFPNEGPHAVSDCESLRYCARLDSEGGFVFLNNYSRGLELKRHTDVQFSINGITFPRKGLEIKNGEYGFLPYRFSMKGVLLLWSASQPLCKSDDTYFFFSPFGESDEMCFDSSTVESVQGNVCCSMKNGRIYLTQFQSSVRLFGKNGQQIQLVMLSRQQARHIYVLQGKVYHSQCHLYSMDGDVVAYGTNPGAFQVQVFKENRFLSCPVDPAPLWPETLKLEELSLEKLSHPCLEEFQLGKTKRRLWRIQLPNRRENLLLRFTLTGDIAQLYADGTLVADCFLNGETWEVGPDSFLQCKELLLTVSALNPEGKYLETQRRDGPFCEKVSALWLQEIPLENF